MKSMPPAFDKDGVHILDPNDRLGYKSEYITITQTLALGKIIPDAFGNKQAIDLGCGWGRLTQLLKTKDWQTKGMDPDGAQITYAQQLQPDIEFVTGGLPDVPVEENSQQLILLNNVLRTLLLLDKTHLANSLSKFLTNSGILVVVENPKKSSAQHFTSNQVIDFFEKQGLKFESKTFFRASRNPLLLPIKYGLIPRSTFTFLASAEISLMCKVTTDPKFQYYNAAYIFKK